MNGKPHLLRSSTKNPKMSAISLKGKTSGHTSSEHKVSWVTMLVAFIAIAAQVVCKLGLGVDLGVNIDLALATGFGSGAAYTVSRMIVKTGIAYAEGKVQAAKVAPRPEVEPEQPAPKAAEAVAATVLPPIKLPIEKPGPFSTITPPSEETGIY